MDMSMLQSGKEERMTAQQVITQAGHLLHGDLHEQQVYSSTAEDYVYPTDVPTLVSL